MKRSSSECNFSIMILDDLEEIRKSENNIVLFGSVGNGKTYLLNKACGSDFPTADSGYSCTRTVQFDYSLRHDMVIIDFPGLNAVQDIMGHLKIQKTALSAIPVRMICFVIKYSPRNDDFERELGQMLSIFNNYIKNVSIIVTKTEDITNKRKEDIRFLFDNKFKIGNVLFSHKKIDGYDLCDNLNIFKNKMDNIHQIIIKTRDLARTVPSLYNKDMAEEREKYEDQFYDTLEKFKIEVEKAEDPDLKRALYFAFKDFKDSLLEEYTNAIRTKKIDGKEPDIDSVVAEVLMFDNTIFNEFNEFRKQIEKTIEIRSSNYNGEYNRFKKCPHCGIIWFKIKGCDSVQCGKRTKTTDKIVGKYKNYIVTYKDNKVVIMSEDLGSDKDLEKNNNPMMRFNSDINIEPMNMFNQMGQMNMNNQMGQMNMNYQMGQMNMNNQMGQMNMINLMGQINMNNQMGQMNMFNQMEQMNMLNQMGQMNMNNQMGQMNMNNQMGQMNMNNQMGQMNMYEPMIMNNMNNVYNEDEFIGLTKTEQLENEKREKDGLIKINPLGCGRELNWKEMEDCSDEVIEKLKEISVDDYYSGLLNISDKIKK